MKTTKKQSRFVADLPCAFGTAPTTPRNGTISSIGIKGCFVKTKVVVTEGQSLFVRVWTTEERWLRLQGTVNYHMERVGFSLLFCDLEESDIEHLSALIELLREQNKGESPAHHQKETVEA